MKKKLYSIVAVAMLIIVLLQVVHRPIESQRTFQKKQTTSTT